VIIETSYLNPSQIEELTCLAVEGGADFIKTSTGFASRGASVDDIVIIKNTLKRLGVEDRVGIKASGGIKTLSFARELLEAGASRIGSSALRIT
jgi:deoxyribose-phosphate aldolase